MNADLSVIELLDFTAGTVRVTDDPSSLPALKQHYLRQAKRFEGVEDKEEEGIDAIYFSGEYPCVYFKRVQAFTPDTVKDVVRIHRKVWNQGKVPFLFVESPTEVRIYNCFDTPRNPDRDAGAEEGILLFSTFTQEDKAKRDLDTLRSVFNKVSIESGLFWQQKEYADQVDIKKRVDRALIDNIKEARLQLRILDLPDGIIHDLLLRSLFILYLQDRGATDQAFYEEYLPKADSYFRILDDKPATYRLFETLETTFNGNLCPIQPGESEYVTVKHLQVIKRCFWSNLALANQPVLFDWRIFDFEFIPIQVISEIYEDFLRKEVGTDQMAKTGAFYTPHALAEFILNQVLPFPSLGKTAYNVRTLDPTCGSGIFLVDSLNRLLDRWEYAHIGEKLTFETIKQIALNNIFGIEIEPEAIKVAAFSIYLAMLDRLDPKTLWQNNRFPYLIYDEDKPEQQRGNNLFRMSSLRDGPFVQQQYDLVVGNPPFTNKVSVEVMDYLTKHNFAKETVIAFLHRVTELCPTGTIALITTSKILFNNGPGYQRFRRFLFNDTHVEKVYNFSALRRVSQKLGGRNMFASATRPVSVLFYSKRKPATPSDKLIYYTPTTAIKNRLIDGIAIDPTDIKYLHQTECQEPDSKVWKVAMWGTERDFKLVKRLFSVESISKRIESNEASLLGGKGFQISKPTIPNDEINKLPHLTAEHVERYYTPLSHTIQINNNQFERLGAVSAYKAPHILIKEGQDDKRFCATYSDFDCSFRNTIYGLHSSDSDYLKGLTACLNSHLAEYLLFLTSTDWGIERERVNPNEMLDLPDLYQALPDTAQKQIVTHVEAIIDLKKANLALSVDQLIIEIENQIEILLWDGLNLSATDRILINDLLAYRLGAFQDRHKSIAFLPVNTEHSQAYATHLCQTINHFLQPDDSIQANAKYFNVGRSMPLQVIILHLDEQKRTNTVEELPTTNLNHILRDLETYTYRQEAESIYFRRFIRYYNSDTIYIVKPNEQRFWSQSVALNDADEIILEILTSEAE